MVTGGQVPQDPWGRRAEAVVRDGPPAPPPLPGMAGRRPLTSPTAPPGTSSLAGESLSVTRRVTGLQRRREEDARGHGAWGWSPAPETCPRDGRGDQGKGGRAAGGEQGHL